MATLTSTGAVNLTSPTNWSPSQIPATGDDLIIGADTLTLDADMTLNTITFNHASSRLAFTGTTRTVQATNGWYITAVIGTTLNVTSISIGTTLTLTGKWNKTGSADAAFNLCSIAGGTLNLRTVGSDLSTLLYEVASTTGFRIASTFTSGTLNTIGRFYTLGGSSLAMVQMSGGTWNHSHSGVSTFGNTFAVLMSVSGLSYVYWTGDIYASLTGGGQPTIFQFNAGFSGLAEITSVITGDNGPSGGSIIRLNTGSPLITGIVRLIGVATMPNTSSIADAISVSSGTFEWKEQTAEIPAGRMCSILQSSSGSVSLVGLTVNNYGKLLLYKTSSGTLAIDSDTSIFNYPPGMVLVRGNESLDDRVIHITNNTLSLPPVETVAAGEVYGYTGFEKTGTGLIVDPAIIAAASTASMTSVLIEYDIATTDDVLATLQPGPGSTAERSIEDDKPLTFSWPNSTDTVTGEVSIDNGSYVAVAGAISYLREEHGKYYYTLAFNAADRPSEEGVARYKFTNGSYTMYATLRITVTNPATVGDWAVKRTFKYNGETLPGVRLLLVGISGKANTSGTDGIAQVNTNNGTFVLRTVVPVGFENIPDEIIIIEDADDISIVELTPMAIPSVGDELCVLQLYLRSQGTTSVAALEDVNITAKLVDGSKVVGPVLHINIKDIAVTDVNGYACLILLQNATYDLAITQNNSVHIKRLRIVTPAESSAIISEVV